VSNAAQTPREPDPSPSSVLPQRHRQRLAVDPADDARPVAFRRGGADYGE
jgi:hypothetical protein